MSLFILILFLIIEPIPINEHSPTFTFPPVITPGPVLEKSSKILSWSIEEEVLIRQCLPIMVLLLIITLDEIKLPSLIVTL